MYIKKNFKSINNTKRPIIQPIEPYSKNVLSYTDYLQIVELAEFLVTFRDQLDPMLVSEFEKGIDVSLIEYAVLDMNPNSSYGELLQCLLATILSQLTEQDKMTPKDGNLKKKKLLTV